MIFFERIRVLPLLILVAALSFAVRLGAFYTGVRSGVAFAQEEVKVDPPDFPAPAAEKTPDKAKAAGKAADAAAPSAPSAGAGPDGDGAAEAPAPDAAEAGKEAPLMLGGPPAGGKGWQDSSDTDIEYSAVKMELFEDLKNRRKAIEDKEKQFAAREALLKAGERELDQKFRELTVLKKEIEGLLQQQSEQEQARLKSLVIIYENMKPKEAARVFDTLDMDVLVSILSRMSERKASPVLAEMNPERARAVTIILAQEKQLPAMPEQAGP